MIKLVRNYNKYEKFIRIGHNGVEGENHTYTCTDLEDFPTPSSMHRNLHDVDKDAFTDLEGYTHRNRVRHDVEDFELAYPILSDDDISYILNRISPDWIYVELTDKKTKQKTIHKMYASDKEFDTKRIWKDEEGNWHEEDEALTFSLVEE